MRIQSNVNFGIVLLLLTILVLFLALLVTHIAASAREARKAKYKQRLFSMVEKFSSGNKAAADFDKFQSKTGIEVFTGVLSGGGEALSLIVRDMVMYTGYDVYIRKQLQTTDAVYCTLVIKLVGELRLQGCSRQIVRFLYNNTDDTDVEYVGLMTLSLLGETNELIKICLDKNFTQRLSFRSLKEVFKHFSGDKDALCAALIQAPDNYIKRVALNLVGDSAVAALTDTVADLLDSDDMNILIDAIRTIGQLQYRRAVPRLTGLMKHDRWEVRNAVVRALANIDVNENASIIINGLQDSEWWVRYNAAMMLMDCVYLPKIQQAVALSSDRFAGEILHFAMQRKALKGGA
ncbi:MAG: HEAT repeat domain-containing protein [Clostridiales bacterium]|nr:HEAT repeat domain-containing protein [Clostridiales bacterium]